MATIETAGPLSKEELIEQASRVIAKVAPILNGQPPQVVGAVLLNLFGGYLSNYHPSQRDALFAAWINGVPDMIRAADRIKAAAFSRRQPPPDKLDS